MCLALTGATILLTQCGSGSDTTSGTAPALEATATSAVVGQVSGEAVDRALELAVLIGSEEQRAALQDAVLTKGEYKSAIVNMLTCAEEGGLAPSDVGIDWNGIFYDYSFITTEPDSGPVDACYRDHAEAVDMAWQLSVSPVREAIESAVLECLLGEGIEVPEGAPLHPIALRSMASEDTWDSCVTKAQELGEEAGFALDPLDWNP